RTRARKCAMKHRMTCEVLAGRSRMERLGGLRDHTRSLVAGVLVTAEPSHCVQHRECEGVDAFVLLLRAGDQVAQVVRHRFEIAVRVGEALHRESGALQLASELVAPVPGTYVARDVEVHRGAAQKPDAL